MGSMAENPESVFHEKPVDEEVGDMQQRRSVAERAKSMSYSEFLIHVREGNIDKVSFTRQNGSITVWTKPECPGRGARRYTLGNGCDPNLYAYLSAHGVTVEVHEQFGKLTPLTDALLRVGIPILMAAGIVGAAMALTATFKDEDMIFGGARMEKVGAKKLGTTFEDVAGIDSVKEEVMEVVHFLRNKVRTCSHL
jgi:cell division protease FtsH